MMKEFTHYLNMYFDGAISDEAIDEGAPVMPAADGKVKNASASATTVWIANQAATAAGDTSYYQNHTTPTMKVGDPLDCLVKGALTAKIAGAVAFGVDLIVDTTNKAFKAAPAENTAPVVGVALFDSEETAVHYGPVLLK